jgi:putative ABC transport system permease protein
VEYKMIYVHSIWSEAMKSLRRNLIRTILTVLGLVVGIAAFICVVGVGKAGSAKVENELLKLGDNMIWIEAGSRATNGVRFGTRETKSLTVEDARAIFAEIPGLKRMSPNVDGRVQVIYGTQNWNTTYRGVAPEYFDIRRWEIQAGTIFTRDDVERDVPVCLLGQTVVENLFSNEDPVGKSIRVQAMPCRVIGVFRPKGASGSGWDQDDFVAMPYTTAMKRIGGTSWLDDIFFSATSRSAIPIATRQAVALLRERHHLHPDEPDDFNIRSPEDVIRVQLQASEIFTLLLGTTASLALLVGGIGIMNIMLVSVTERTREIGVRLAVGATETDIQFQFLAEAIVISLLGGLLGVLGGVAASSLFETMLRWEINLTPQLLIFTGLFVAGIGIFFGFYPSRKAAQLNPIEALRYEQ